MPEKAGRSSRRSIANRLAAASARSPRPAEPEYLGKTGRRIGAKGEQRLAGAGVDGVEAQRQPGGVMARQHARRSRRTGAGHGDRAEERGQIFQGDGARTQQHGSLAGQVEHRRFEPDRAAPAIEDQRDRRAQLCGDMRGLGRADPSRAVGRGRRDRAPRRIQQRLRDRIGRYADRHRVEPGARQERHPAVRAAAQHEAQRPRPEPAGDVPGALVEDGQRRRLGQARNMHDQRVEARPALRREDFGDGAIIRRIAAEAVNRLGWKGDEAAGAQQCRGAGDCRRVSRRNRRGHRRHSPPGRRRLANSRNLSRLCRRL